MRGASRTQSIKRGVGQVGKHRGLYQAADNTCDDTLAVYLGEKADVNLSEPLPGHVTGEPLPGHVAGESRQGGAQHFSCAWMGSDRVRTRPQTEEPQKDDVACDDVLVRVVHGEAHGVTSCSVTFQ